MSSTSTTTDPVHSESAASASSTNGQATKRTTSNLLQASNDGHPTLIIIFAWLGATAPTLRRYSDSYRKLYPSSAQIVVNSDPLRFWKPASVRERALGPIVKVLEDHIAKTPGGHPPRILLHVMSNGGVCSLVDLASAIRKRGLRTPDGTRCAMVIDSAPALATFTVTHRAFTAGIRNRLKKYLMMAFLSSVYVVTVLVGFLRRSGWPMQHEMEALNDPRLLPWTSTRTRRIYIYSSGDQIVPARGVEEHAAKARLAGFPTQMAHFARSAHVAHAREDPDKYWRSIKTLWAAGANISAGVGLCRL
ncbi:hypothetical protein GY45DRAFT_1370182 [Cubamyces sp. BRFM 1775]|nr:hypothetical protein GY45DRAFT_1370182 [Cubamyces sp. BRFM 1775]